MAVPTARSNGRYRFWFLSPLFHITRLRASDSIGNAMRNRTYLMPTAPQKTGPLRGTTGSFRISRSGGGGITLRFVKLRRLLRSCFGLMLSRTRAKLLYRSFPVRPFARALGDLALASSRTGVSVSESESDVSESESVGACFMPSRFLVALSSFSSLFSRRCAFRFVSTTVSKRVLPFSTRTRTPTSASAASRSMRSSTSLTCWSSWYAGRPSGPSGWTCGRPSLARLARLSASLRRWMARPASAATKSSACASTDSSSRRRASSSSPWRRASSASTASGSLAWCRLLNMNCISCTSISQVQTSDTTWKPIMAAVLPSMNLFRILRFARASRRLNAITSALMHPNMPPTTANTFQVRIRSSRDTESSSSTVTGLILGGALDAVKSVAWSHRHSISAATTHPHPSKDCESRRQAHRAAFETSSASQVAAETLLCSYPSTRVTLSSATSVTASHPASTVSCVNCHRNEAFASEMRTSPSRTPGAQTRDPPGGRGLGSVAHPSELYAFFPTSQKAHTARLAGGADAFKGSVFKGASCCAHVTPARSSIPDASSGSAKAMGTGRSCTASSSPLVPLASTSESVPAMRGAAATSVASAEAFAAAAAAAAACASKSSASRNVSTGSSPLNESAEAGTSNTAPPVAAVALEFDPVAARSADGERRDAT